MPENAPEWLQTTTVETVNGTPSRALVAADLAHVAWAVNLGCLGFHVWPSLAADQAHADELRLDLDPQPGTDFTHVREAAAELKRLLDEVGIAGYPKTTGNRGLHVYVRLRAEWDSYQVRSAAVAVARELARRRPDVITDAWWKEERGERVFVDYNQNAPHKTVFGAWSARSRVGGQVSMPLRWEDVEHVHPDELTLATAPGAARGRRRPVGRRSATRRSRSSRCSPCTSATARTASRRAVAAGLSRSSRTSRRAWRRAALRSRLTVEVDHAAVVGVRAGERELGLRAVVGEELAAGAERDREDEQVQLVE